ncbi:MAG: PQQ-binding-like beta-propeller repeat protein [Acidobacteriota bacterium]
MKRSWWPLVVVLLLFAGRLAWIWMSDGGNRQSQVMASAISLIVAGFLILVWLLLMSPFSWGIRLRFIAAFALVVLMGSTLFRIEGVDGDLRPIVGLRWGGELTTPTTGDAAMVEAGPGDFPQFLGPARNGKIDSIQLDPDWESSPPELVWRQPIGDGWSGFAVVGNAAITQEHRGPDELVSRYELDTGALVWTYATQQRYETTIGGTGPRATPTVAGDRVITVGATGHLAALDLVTGEALWSHELADFDVSTPDWGRSASPMVLHDTVLGSTVIVPAGGTTDRPAPALIAFDLASGDELWRSEAARNSYSSPVLFELAGYRQIVLFEGASVSGYALDDGSRLWQTPWDGERPNVALPVRLDADRFVVSTGYGIGAAAYRLTATSSTTATPRSDESASDESATDESASDEPTTSSVHDVTFELEQLWKTPRLKAKFSNFVFHDGALYGFDDGVFVSLDPETGERNWKAGRYGHGQLLLIDDHLLVLAEDGRVLLLRADPTEHIELASFRALDDKTWNTPALAGPYLLARNTNEVAVWRLPVLE